ncbi:uncharacterized protein LOC133179134 isoform X2 [Saccostrea echinata]|uniref:uncharacterized protein LOC133179134 isoform X2 n=1 Tax=Saccostrea echinata TaxID=191078 RepID=UPI002A839EAE|nr:uncharacterized protein LOC133179134 isoform X2 [Saccostrea echinata]
MRSMYHLAIIVHFLSCVSFINGEVLINEMEMRQGKRGNITILYTIRNKLADPKFEYEQNVTSKAGQPFIRFMEQAADDDKNFQFSSKYYAKLGYFIEILGKDRAGVFGLAYWQFIKAPCTVLPVGVSSYIPKDGDHLIFDYVLQGNCSTCKPPIL